MELMEGLDINIFDFNLGIVNIVFIVKNVMENNSILFLFKVNN